MPDRLILAVETTLARCSVALVRGEQVLAQASEPMQRGHAERLAPMAEEVMASAGGRFDGLGRIAVTTGPGSFTGVRVGLAFARGLALALGVPIVGLSSLEVLALAEGKGGWRAGVIPSAEGVFFALYEDGEARIAPVRLSLEEARGHLTGRSVRLYGPAATEFVGLGGACSVLDAPCVLALARLAAGKDPGENPANPLYLRAALA